MDLKEMKAAIGRPQIARLKAVGKGVRIGVVLGDRVLIKPIVPYTEMDEVEKKGLVVIPATVREANTPLPSTGIIVQLGTEVHVGGGLRNFLEEGTGVLFSKYAGTEFIIDEVVYRILKTDEIMATFVTDDEDAIAEVSSAS